jgi:hypothetical protein
MTAVAGNLSHDIALQVVPFEMLTGTTDAAWVLVEEVVGEEAVDEGEEADVGG